ncbi:hypothetical protein [Halioglobus sp. HI00S01]|uniref:hypothetical protein n=1 Tax=Halioglobus sp. HI00S01 TaxID=1822214 RepID=UPI0012E884D3|nr:hypothetical protein [Halioglobus sp. HI00S01]
MAWGVAAINVMVTTLQADYPQEKSWGKFVGATGFAIGVGALFLVLVLARLPGWYSSGNHAIAAGQQTLNTVAAIAFASSLLSWFGLKRTATVTASASPMQPWHQRLRRALQLGWQQPRIRSLEKLNTSTVSPV